MREFLKLNRTMIAAKELTNSGWLQVFFGYLVYAAVMVGVTMFFMHVIVIEQIYAMLIQQSLAAIATVAFMLTVGKRTPASLGMSMTGFFRQYGFGWLIAAGSLLAVWLANLFFKAVSTAINPNVHLFILFLMLIGFIFQGFMEEFLLRSLIMTQASIKFGVIIAILFNSLLFGLGHLGNNDATWISVSNTVLIGVVFSLQFYYHDNIWLVSGFHSGWNFILGPILGIAVSGFTLPTSLLTSESDPALASINGGGYGFEAGAPVFVLCLILTAVYVWLIAKRKRAEEN